MAGRTTQRVRELRKPGEQQLQHYCGNTPLNFSHLYLHAPMDRATYLDHSACM
jgi:hypothetical protein